MVNPDLALEQAVDLNCFKLYIADIGLFTSMIFNNQNGTGLDIYKKLLSDKLSANLGYMYENVVAQMLVAGGRNLYYHTWQNDDGSLRYEIDFLTILNKKLTPIEVKSSATKKHKSIDDFCDKYSSIVGRRFLMSQKDVGHEQMLEFKPIYMLPFILE